MKLRRIIYRTLTIIFHPFLSKERNVIFDSRFFGTGKASVRMKDSVVKRSEIRFLGEGHSFEASKCCLHNCNIFLRGKGHRLVIDEDVRLFNIRIKIIGENNVVHVGKSSSLDGGNIIAGGVGTSITIGEGCMISEGLDIWNTDTHSIFQDDALLNPPKSIEIGNYVWLGKDVAILKGVVIGDNAVVGMKSVVTKSIRPSTLNVGSPSREIQSDINWSRKNPNN